MRFSIRQRLTAWYAGALLLGMSAFGTVTWMSLHHRLMAAVDARVESRMAGLKTALTTEADIHDEEGLRRELDEIAYEVSAADLLQLCEPAGRIILPAGRSLTIPPHAGRSSPDTELVAGHPFRVVAAPVAVGGVAYTAQVGIPLDDTLAILRDYRRLMFWMMPAVLLVSCLGGFWLSSRALRPVDAITTAARTITVENLSQRMVVPNTGDELQRMAETWNDVLARLESSIDRIRQFTSDASHELRTPLALIRSTAELALRRARDPESYRASLRQIEQEAEGMTALTESLLVLARADAGSLGLKMERVDVAQLVCSVVEQSQPMAVEKGIQLHSAAGGEGPELPADAAGLRRVLLILLDNAFKHTPAGGSVTVSAKPVSAGVLIAVEDTGEGIPAEALPHIFERFYRADAARSSGAGFGLGLSIAQAIARVHSTSITAVSEPGAGARFSLLLKK